MKKFIYTLLTALLLVVFLFYHAGKHIFKRLAVIHWTFYLVLLLLLLFFCLAIYFEILQ